MKKIISLVCAVILVVSFAGIFIPTPIQAATINELTQQLNALLAQVANLQARLATATGGSTVPSPSARLFSSSNPALQVGSEKQKKNDVIILQKTLSNLGYRISNDESGVFGRSTQAAVIAFQNNNNITPAVGYVGGITTAALTTQSNNNSFTTNSTSQQTGGGAPCTPQFVEEVGDNCPTTASTNDFTLSISPDIRVLDKQGDATTYTVTVTPKNGFQGKVTVNHQYTDGSLALSSASTITAQPAETTSGVILDFAASSAAQTIIYTIDTTDSVRPSPLFRFRVQAYANNNPEVYVIVAATLNIHGGCNDPGSGNPPCGATLPVNCLPDAGGAPFDKEVMVGEKTRFVSSGGGNHIVWSAPGATPSSKDNTTQGACTYRPRDQHGNLILPLYPDNYCPQDGVFETTFAQEGSYLVTVSSPPDTITHFDYQQAGAIQGPHATCKVKVSKAPTPPAPGSLSCTATGANATFGLINYTVSGATADTQCSWSCTPGSAGCPTTANAVGGGAQSYGPVTSATQITLTCNRPNGTNYSAAQATCSTTIGGTGTNTGNTGNSTSSNSTSTGNTGTGNTGTGNTGTGNTTTTTTGGAGFTCSAGACTVVSTGAQYSTLASCRTACSGGNGNTGDTGTGNTGNTGNTGSSSTTPFACTPATQTIAPGSATFTATGAASYSWFSAGANPLSGSGSTFTASYPNTGTYTATVFGSNPSGVAACTVNVVTPGTNAGTPTCSATPNPAIVGQQVLFRASGATGSYSWSATDGTSTSGSGALFATSFTTAGTKTVTVTSGGVSGTCSVVVATITPITGTITNFNSVGLKVLSPQAGASLPIDGGINQLDIWYRVDDATKTKSGIADLLKDGAPVRALGAFPVACGSLGDPTLCTYPANLLNAPANGADLVVGDNYRIRVRGSDGAIGYSAPFSLRHATDAVAVFNDQLQVVFPKGGESLTMTSNAQAGNFLDVGWSPARAGVKKVELVKEGTGETVVLGDSTLGSMPAVFYGYYPFRINTQVATAGSYKIRVTDNFSRTAVSAAPFTLVAPVYESKFTFDQPIYSKTLQVGAYPNFRDFYFKVPKTLISQNDSIIDWQIVELSGKNPVDFNTIPVSYPSFDYTAQQWVGYMRVSATVNAVPGTYRFQLVARVRNADGSIRTVPSDTIDFTVTSGATSAVTPSNQNLASVLDAARLLLQQLLGKL